MPEPGHLLAIGFSSGACLAGIGLVAGVIGGMLGVGGSIIMIPAMMFLLGPELHTYQGAAMIVNFFVVLPASIQHARAGAVVPKVVRVMVPAAIVAVLAGVTLSESRLFAGHNTVYLARVFGGFLWYVAAYNVWRVVRPIRDPLGEARQMPSPWLTALAVGVPTGFMAGLLGIGGGAIAVPCQQIFLRLPLRKAIANSATTIVFLSAVGATYKDVTLIRHGVDAVHLIGLAAVLIPTAVLGGTIGARLTHRISMPHLRVVFVVLMLYAGYHLMRYNGPVAPAQELRGVPTASAAGL